MHRRYHDYETDMRYHRNKYNQAKSNLYQNNNRYIHRSGSWFGYIIIIGIVIVLIYAMERKETTSADINIPENTPLTEQVETSEQANPEEPTKLSP